MDILDEIDAAIHEKRSKWNYTPMREKSETDAIIDELLLEFSSDSYSRNKRRQTYTDRASSAVKKSESVRTNTPVYTERNTVENAEQQERFEYEKAVKRSISSAPGREELYVPQSDNSDYYDDYEEYESYDGEYSPDEYDDYDEDYDDEGYSEYTDDRRSSGGDFDRFMDSENDGERGDIPKFSLSGLVKIILKILVLAVFGAFAVTGIINTISIGINKFGSSSNTSETSDLQKKELQSVIYPLIVTGVDDFENISELKDEDFINIGVWELVINGDKSVFKDEESGEILLPQDQMTYIIEKLFGEETKFSHTTAGIGDIVITYDKKNKQYIIPDDTDLYSYYPVVTDVAETGDSFTVYADCYRSLPSWNSGKSDPAKRIMITLNKTSEYYNIVSLKTIPVD